MPRKKIYWPRRQNCFCRQKMIRKILYPFYFYRKKNNYSYSATAKNSITVIGFASRMIELFFMTWKKSDLTKIHSCEKNEPHVIYKNIRAISFRGGSMTEERRKRTRVPVAFDINILFQNDKIKVKTFNLSLTGISCTSDPRFRANELCEIILTLTRIPV